jgi:hypothetical protein
VVQKTQEIVYFCCCLALVAYVPLVWHSEPVLDLEAPPGFQAGWSFHFLYNVFIYKESTENLEDFQLHRNHEKIIFLTVLLLFVQFKMHYW